MFGGSPKTVNFCRQLFTAPRGKSSHRGIFSATLVAATLHHSTVTFADSSILDKTGASLMAATLHLRAMPHAKSSISGTTGASLVTATLHLRAMPDTNSSPNSQFGASLAAATFTHVFVTIVKKDEGVTAMRAVWQFHNDVDL